MLRHLRLAKITKSHNGAYAWVGSASDDRLDCKSTRLDVEIFQSFIDNTEEFGMPWLGVAHYQDGRIGITDRMWIDGHFLKLSGTFDDTEMSAAAVRSLQKDARIREIQQSVGFYPTTVTYEEDILVYLQGWLEHTALTVAPANVRTDIQLIMNAGILTRYEDACAIVGSHFASELEQRDHVRKLREEKEGKSLWVPDLPLGRKSDVLIDHLCRQVAAPSPIVVFSNKVIEPPTSGAPRVLCIDDDMKEWLTKVEGEVALDAPPIVALSRLILEGTIGTEIKLSDNDVITVMRNKPSYAYLERMVSIMKEMIPVPKLKDAYKLARGHAGGKGSPNKPTSILTDSFKASPASRIADLTDSPKVSKLARAMLAIIEANDSADLPDAERSGNISTAISDFKAAVLATKSEAVEKGALPYKDLPLADEGMAWDSTAADKRVRKWAGGPAKDDMNWGKYSQAFLWVDSDNKENFTGYKLPFADIVDGSLKAVPRGVFAAAGALQGARGGVDIPSTDIEKAKNHLGSYYKKLDRTPPWDSGRSEYNLKAEIIGLDKVQHIYYGVVLEPNVLDEDGLVADEAEILKAQRLWGAGTKQIWLLHKGKIKGAYSIRSFCTETKEAFEHPVFGRQTVPKGTWIEAIKVDDPNTRKALEKGELVGLSLRALVTIMEVNND